MKYFYIGTPGERSRLSCPTFGEAMGVARDMEVICGPQEQGDWVHSADGKSLIAWSPPLPWIAMRKWGDVKGKRSAVIAGGLTVPGIGTFDTDDEARSNVTGAAIAAQSALMSGHPLTVEWTLSDNSRIELDAQQIIQVHMAGVAFINMAHERAAVLRAEIEAASTRAALDAIDVDAGWPG